MPWLEGTFSEIKVEDVYKTDENLKKEDVDTLMHWNEIQPHLPRVTELQIILFLHRAMYNTEDTKKLIDNYFTIKTSAVDIFGSRTLSDPLFNNATKCILMAPLVTRTNTGDLIVIGKLMDFNSSNYNVSVHIRLFDVITLLYLHQNGPVNGMQLIADLSHATFGHLMKLNPAVVKCFLHYLQDAMPVRLRYVHIINATFFLDKALIIAKALMKKELYQSIKVHSAIEGLYEYIPQQLLPLDYGGYSDSTQILQEKVINLIGSCEEFLIFQESQVVDESKRPKVLKVEKSSSQIGRVESLKLENNKNSH